MINKEIKVHVSKVHKPLVRARNLLIAPVRLVGSHRSPVSVSVILNDFLEVIISNKRNLKSSRTKASN
jgi:hypothetical protein